MQFIFIFCVSCSSLCVMVDFYLLELLEGNLIFRNWQVVGFKIPKCVWCGRWADCVLGLQYSVCNSILIHVQLRFWTPSAAWNIFFPLSYAQQDNNTAFENYRGAFCCYLYYRHWYAACIPHFSNIVLCDAELYWWGQWLLAISTGCSFVHPHARSKPYLSVQPSVGLHTNTKTFPCGHKHIWWINSLRQNE